MKWAGVVCALLIAWWGFRVFGQTIEPPTERDTFIYGVATEFGEPRLCEKISRYASGGGGSEPGYQVSYLQSKCYYRLAGSLHDVSLCDKVRTVSKGFLDGSKLGPESCRLDKDYSGDIVDPHVVVSMMRKLGYLDQEVHDFQYRNSEGNPVYDAYSRLRKDALFAERIKDAPTFNEPVSVAQTRPANDLEYVYQMFAVDTDNAAPCDKISPNAEAAWPKQKPFSLKLECNRAVALDKPDPSGCEKLPPGSGLSSGAAADYSREACLHAIEVMRPDLGGHYRHGPIYPPTFSSFQNGLHELGYDLTFPEPTWADYGKFLIYLSDTRQPNAAARAEFLRRVAAME